jgi:malonyl-CoA O-methyltransferase
VDAARAVFAEAARVLPGGLFMFSTFGRHAQGLRAAFVAVDGYQHVNTFVDMHDPRTVWCTRGC